MQVGAGTRAELGEGAISEAKCGVGVGAGSESGVEVGAEEGEGLEPGVRVEVRVGSLFCVCLVGCIGLAGAGKRAVWLYLLWLWHSY